MPVGKTIAPRFHHCHLIVSDVPKAVAFYEETLGARIVKETEFRGIPFVRLELDGLQLAISQQLHEGVSSHIGLTVDDFETTIAELRAKGVEFFIDPTDIGFIKFAFIKDPAGTDVEIMQFIDDPG